MASWLPDDVLRRIETFPSEHRADLRARLEQLAGIPEPARVARCVLWLAGDHARVGHFLQCALADYRDVLWWGEYDGGETRLRDFTNPLP